MASCPRGSVRLWTHTYNSPQTISLTTGGHGWLFVQTLLPPPPPSLAVPWPLPNPNQIMKK